MRSNVGFSPPLPQVCAVHTLQALVRGSGLGVAVLQFAPAVAILSLTLLSSPCWAMRNAALQLYSKNTISPSHYCNAHTEDRAQISVSFVFSETDQLKH